jgi:hypothetical protein
MMGTLTSKINFQGVFRDESVANFNAHSQYVLGNISTCHTAKRGYHLYQCDNTVCEKTKFQYHCCGNRHCPYCGTMKRDEWVENRMNELLPTAYYHVVFTLPHELNSLILGNRKLLFTSLFDSASQTLLNHGKNIEFLGAEPGITMVLHTWGQDLSFHPHVHCIVTGGGFAGNTWVKAKRENSKFLFPTKSLASMYKAMFMASLEQNIDIKWGEINKTKLLKSIKYKTWNVYAKAPFGGPAQVIEYLGRYTHKIAITKHRILDMTDDAIKFKYKDYADNSKTKTMWLRNEEFLRRFELHILPSRFVKIRHTGFLRSKNKTERLNSIRASMGLRESLPKVQIPAAIRMLEKYGKDISQCLCCQTGKLVLILDTRVQRREKVKPLNITPPS